MCWISAKRLDIDLALTASWYPYIYAFAFLLGGFILWREGRKQGVSMAQWMLLMSSAVFMLIAGTRLGTFDLAEWRHWWVDGTPLLYGRKTAIGGLLIGFLGLWLVRSLLGYRKPLWDAFALYLPLTLILHRCGCLFAGCCSGLPTGSSWGLTYQGPGWLRDVHELLGHIPVGSAATLPVHPVPVYEMMTSLIILAVLFGIRNRSLPRGSRILISLGMMLIARFFLEFLREPMGNFSMGSTSMGLKTVQWICLGLLLLLSFRARYLMRMPEPDNAREAGPLGHRHWILMVVMLALVLKGERFFTSLERIVLLAHLMPTLGLMLYASGFPYRITWNAPFLRIALPSVMILLFAGMEGDPIRGFNGESHQRTSFYLRANQVALPGPRYPCLRQESGCLGAYCAEKDLQRPVGPGYTVFQGGVEHVEKSPYRTWSWVIGADAQIERFSSDTSSYKLGMGNFHLFGGIEGDRYIGIRLGMRTGTIFQDSDYDVKPITPFLDLTSRFWAGYHPWAVLQLGYYDPVVAGLSASSTYAMVNANAGLFAPRFLDRTRFGIANLAGFREDLLFWDLDVRLGRHWVVSPSLTLIKRNADITWGFGAGLKYTVSKSS